MQDKLNHFERNTVCYLIHKPEGRIIIGTKWVFKNKLDEHRTITRKKTKPVV